MFELVHNQSLEVWDVEFEVSHHCVMIGVLLFLLQCFLLLLTFIKVIL